MTKTMKITLILLSAVVLTLGTVVYLKTTRHYNAITPHTQSTSTIFTMAEVSSHNLQNNCYTVISGSVYDLTNWISAHPGGDQAILSLCGIDGTEAFAAQHGNERQPEAILKQLKVGTITSN